jgi:hypothetical protein
MKERIMALVCSGMLAVAIPVLPTQARALAQDRSQAQSQAQTQAGSDNPRITGKWVLNQEQSDDPQAAFQGPMPGGRGDMREGRDRPPGGPPSGGQQPGGRPPGGQRPGGARPGGGDPEQMRQTMQKLMQASAALNIVQDDSTVTIVGIEGSRVVLYPDGRKLDYLVEGAGNVETRANWIDGRLVVERRLEGGARATQTYELASEGRQMHIRVRLEGSQLPAPVEFRQVYELQDGGS